MQLSSGQGYIQKYQLAASGKNLGVWPTHLSLPPSHAAFGLWVCGARASRCNAASPLAVLMLELGHVASSCSSWALGVGSIVLAHRLCCSVATWDLPGSGWNPCLLHIGRQILNLSHQGSPRVVLLKCSQICPSSAQNSVWLRSFRIKAKVLKYLQRLT